MDSIYTQIKALKKQETDPMHLLWNRIKSILKDLEFTESLLQYVDGNVELYANERAGAWYFPPFTEYKSVHFKSTDAHQGAQKFSIRRTNLHLIRRFSQGIRGCIILDTTRSGKQFPDALSRTIPTWCCLMTRLAALLNGLKLDETLYMHPQIVPPTESTQVDNVLIPQWIEIILSSNLDLSNIKELKLPLRPLWVRPEQDLSFLSQLFIDTQDYIPLVLVMTSTSQIERSKGYLYVQGAGDDEESWSDGLSALQFRQFYSDIKSTTSPMEMWNIVQKAKQFKVNVIEEASFDIIHPLNLAIGNLASARDFDYVINCSNVHINGASLFLDIPEGKKGKTKFLTALPRVLDWFSSIFSELPNKSILICSCQGKDRAAGIALAILARFATLEPLGWNVNVSQHAPISRNLLNSWAIEIMKHRDCSMSGITIKSVNHYFSKFYFTALK